VAAIIITTTTIDYYEKQQRERDSFLFSNNIFISPPSTKYLFDSMSILIIINTVVKNITKITDLNDDESFSFFF
jgi:hypothetical protein